jgi:hypothetical protein
MTRRPGFRRLPVAALLLIAAAGCRGEAPDAYLQLSWEEFDQTPTSGWRPLAAGGDYAGAARMIEAYLERHDDLPAPQRGYSLFHAGQLWALHGDTERALAHIDRATVPDMPPEFPRSFNALVAGTRGFLRGDTATVRAARDRVAALPDRTARDDEFLEALELLARSEGLTYREVYAAAIE